MKEHFIKAKENLINLLAQMSSEAENSVYGAIHAVETCSLEEAKEIINKDYDIDALENEIEEECLKTLALYQPVASDLRQIIMVLKVNNEVERVGDLAVNIAERVEDICFYQDKGIDRFNFHDMVKKASEMLRKSLDSLTYLDVVMARSVLESDDAVDDIHRNNYRRVSKAILKHADGAQYYMDCLTISRCLERIADIATNIAEDVIYMQSGIIVRHQHEGEKNGE
ncbi:MAG: phosphate signaling complex protein PhoU [Lentisphaeria bacterium]